MRKHLLLIIIILFSKTVTAQTWSWARASANGSGSGKALTTDASGNVYITGNYDDMHISFGAQTLNYAGQSDSYLVKYDPSGNVVWANNIGSSCGDFANSVCTDASGNVFVTGYFCSASLTIGTYTLPGYSGFFNIFLAKYDANGNVLWARTANGTTSCDNMSYSIAADNTGNCFITGTFSSSTITFGSTVLNNGGASGSNTNIFIAKFDPSGNALWAKKAGTNNNAKAYAICTDANGNAFITGSYRSANISFDGYSLTNTGMYDSYLVKYSADGTVQWAKSTTCDRDDEGKAVSSDAAGNIYITGYFSGTNIVFSGNTLTNANPPAYFYRNNMFLVKYDAAGNVKWARNAGGSATCSTYGYGVSAYNNGVYVSGEFNCSSMIIGSYTLTPVQTSYNPLFIAHYNASGDVVYATYLESGGNLISSLRLDGFNNLYVTGSFGYGASPLTIGSFSLTTGGINTVFLAKLSSAVVIPVKLNNLKVALQNNKAVQLTWHTEEELNIDQYIITRSTSPNSAFEQIGYITARGGSSGNDYYFVDDKVKTGITYYYRIAVVEHGGISKYSDIVQARLTGKDGADVSFANPSGNLLHLNIQGITGPVQFTVINSKGQAVLKKQLNIAGVQQIQLDISGLASGLYQLNVKNDATQITRTFIKR